eukprot:458354_1
MEELKYNKSETNIYDVIIIGAGFSGLSAALYLQDCNINNILVLEARNRVGGRVCTEYVSLDGYNKPCPVDVGGTYTGYGQNRLLKMAQRFNVKTYKIYQKGNIILNNEGNIRQLGLRDLFNENIIDLNYIIQQCNKLANGLKTKHSNNTKLIKEYDSISLSEFIKSLIPNNKTIQNVFNCFINTLLTVESSECSLLFFLSDINQSAPLDAILDDAQNRKFIGGSHSICAKMSDEINKSKTKINLQHIVKYIEHNNENEKCTIICKNGKTFHCKYIILCIPPVLYKKIEFKPKLCWEREHICNKFQSGYVIKVNVFYKTAFWREKNLSGISINCGYNKNMNEFPICITLDDVTPDGRFASIIGLITADKAINFALKYNESERKELILQQYYKLFGDKRAINECIGYIEKIWHNEEFSMTGYGAIATMNTLSQLHYNKIFECEGNRLYFACTELSDKWCGYIDGAINSGQREANKIANLLKNEYDKNEAIKENKIRVVKYFKNEPEPENCECKYVDHTPGYVQKNLPNSNFINNCCCLCTIICGGLVLAYCIF